MNAGRLIALGALLIALGIYTLSALPEDPEAYLFPRLISIGMALLAVALLVESFSPAGQEHSYQRVPWTVIAPGLAIFVIYLYAIEEVGFYFSAFVAFFVLVTIYAPERRSVRGWVNRSSVAALFIGVVYAVFGLLLKVQTPAGLLF
jgi:hypothetical protein